MTVEISKTQFEGMVEDAIKAKFGLTIDQMEERLTAVETADARKKSEHDKVFVDGMLSDFDAKYYRAARPIIESDEHKGKGLRFARACRAIRIARENACTPEEAAKTYLHSDWLADDLAQAKTMQATQGGGTGGFLVPPQYVAEFIELLRAASVVRAAGPVQIDMERNTLGMPRQSGAATAYYQEEGAVGTPTDQGLQFVQLVGRTLMSLTAVSNDLLKYSSPSADELVRNDLLMVTALREDLAFLRGDGANSTPRGLRYWAAAANGTASAGTSVANIITDFVGLINDLEVSDVALVRPHIFMSPRTKNAMASLRDSAGDVFPGLMTARQIYGIPFSVSTQIPTNLGGGSNESEIIMAEMSQVIVGTSTNLELSFHENGAWDDGAGNMRSGVNTNESVFRVIHQSDIITRHDEAVAYRSGVTYTP